ncbi:hypothetical protein ACFWQL_39090 [Amycolatopsis thermoflava]|uniref:hypothetical protein n=1 Tax=Amycolatopsis thermoflava TaxID=84480 RepID=UPI0036544DEC
MLVPYEDPDRSADERVRDLIARMTLAEKTELLCHAPIAATPDGGFVEESVGMMPTAPTTETLRDRHLRCFTLMTPVAAGPLARWHNRLQDLAARTRLGIPVLISSDPASFGQRQPAHRGRRRRLLALAGAARLRRDPRRGAGARVRPRHPRRVHRGRDQGYPARRFEQHVDHSPPCPPWSGSSSTGPP